MDFNNIELLKEYVKLVESPIHRGTDTLNVEDLIPKSLNGFEKEGTFYSFDIYKSSDIYGLYDGEKFVLVFKYFIKHAYDSILVSHIWRDKNSTPKDFFINLYQNIFYQNMEP